MRKMPCLFVREFVNNRIANITEEVTPGCEWVLRGEGMPYVKRDGTACAIIGGVLHRRYDAKRGKAPPPSAIPCDPSPDPVTGHWPHWLPIDTESPADKWYSAAWLNLIGELPAGTYELCGPHFQGNPERLDRDMFFAHDSEPVGGGWVNEVTSFAALRGVLASLGYEGIVFHHPDGRMAKIRRADFGFSWPIKDGEL